MLAPRQFRASSFSANRLGAVERPEHTPESGRCPSETLSWQTAPVVIHLRATPWTVAERERYPDSNRSLPIRSSIFANSSLGTATSATPVRAGRTTESPVVGADVDRSPRDGRREPHRALGDEGPELVSRRRVEATDGVVRRRPVEEPAVRDRDVEREVVNARVLEPVELVPVVGGRGAAGPCGPRRVHGVVGP